MDLQKINTRKFEYFCSCALALAGVFLLGFLSFYSVHYTAVFPTNHDNIPQTVPGSALFTLALVLVVLAALFWIGKWILKDGRHRERNIRLLLIFTCVYAAVYGIGWAFFCKYYMTWDQKLVSFFAEQLAFGIDDMSASDLDYIGAYPHQIGLIAFMELLYRLCGSENYHAFQVANALAAGGIVFVGHKIVDEMSERKEAGVYFLLLMLGCHPLYIYASFVYGEVLSVLFSLLAVYGLLCYLKKREKRQVALMAGSIVLACLIRSNCYIVLAAIGCVLAVKSVSDKTLRHLAALGVCILSFFVVHGAIVRVYENRLQVSLRDGMPSVLWVAMGLNEVEGGAGWHDESFYKMFVDETNGDRSKASRLGSETVKEKLSVFKENPAYGLDFMKRKVLSQWNDPTYACQQETNPRITERGPLAERFYKGDLKAPFTKCMDVYQAVIYLGLLVYFLMAVRRRQPLEHLTLWIVILGGFLFYLFWEAKSRYIFPYFMMMIPMAAVGCEQIFAAVRGWKGRGYGKTRL